MAKTTDKMPETLELWGSHFNPPPDACKPFTRAGGFKGTAIDPMWLIRSATEQWGPFGYKWGIDVLSTEVIVLSETNQLHVVSAVLWYDHKGSMAKVPCFGQTWLVSPGKNGPIYDEEAPKKSLTDALAKALSWLGFGAAVHMGVFDGNKYTDLPEGLHEQTKASDARASAQANAHPSGVLREAAVAVWTDNAANVRKAAGTDVEGAAKTYLLDTVRATAKRLNINPNNRPSAEQLETLVRETGAAINAAAETAAATPEEVKS